MLLATELLTENQSEVGRQRFLDHKQKGHRFRWPFSLSTCQIAVMALFSSVDLLPLVRMQDAQNGIPARPQGARRPKGTLGVRCRETGD